MKVYSLEDYVKDKKMTRVQYEAVCSCIENRENITIGGKKSSGKTTLVNAIIQKMVELDPDRSLYLVGKIRELNCDGNRYKKAMLAASEIPDAIKAVARMKKDTVVMDGLCTAGAAAQMLGVWRNGYVPAVTSLTTISEGGASAVTERIMDFVSMAKHADKNLVKTGTEWISRLGLIVCISAKGQGKIEQMQREGKII